MQHVGMSVSRLETEPMPLHWNQVVLTTTLPGKFQKGNMAIVHKLYIFFPPLPYLKDWLYINLPSDFRIQKKGQMKWKTK